ncbi:MAG: hypothetical protein RLZZ528_336 [Pseudomonadota bacterium]
MMLDWDRITELRDEIGTDAFGEVVELFLDEVESALLRLGAEGPVEEGLHFLKGCALNLGFRRFATVTSEGEMLARAGRGGEVDLAQVREVYAQSKRQFVAGLSDSGGLRDGTSG